MHRYCWGSVTYSKNCKRLNVSKNILKKVCENFMFRRGLISFCTIFELSIELTNLKLMDYNSFELFLSFDVFGEKCQKENFIKVYESEAFGPPVQLFKAWIRRFQGLSSNSFVLSLNISVALSSLAQLYIVVDKVDQFLQTLYMFFSFTIIDYTYRNC